MSAGGLDFGVARAAPLQQLPGAMRLSDDPDLRDAVEIVRFVRAHPAIHTALKEGFGNAYDPLSADDDPALWTSGTPLSRRGRPRVEGEWPLLFLAYVLSRVPSIQAFAHLHRHSTLWQECGFAEAQSYATVNRRFGELETYVERTDSEGNALPDGFARAFGIALDRARDREPQIGRVVTVDGHAASTRAALVHACPPETPCGQRQRGRAQHRSRGKAPQRAPHGVRMPPLSVEEVNEDRHAEAREPVAESRAQSRSNRALKLLSSEEVQQLGLDEALKWWAQRTGNETHYFCCLDTSAGARMYGQGSGKGGKRRRKKFWLGWNGQTATCALTGAALALRYIPNEEQEYHAYPRVLDEIERAIGQAPHAVSLDAGYGTKDLYAHNVRRGIATVASWRATTQHSRRRHLENEVADRHGIPRCQHCGAPGKTSGSGLGFVVTEYGTPIIRFRCRAKLTDDCRRVQSADCRQEPRLLGPLPRTSKLYNQMRQAHSPSERVHLHARQRYCLASREVTSRDYRLGMRWQQLRANAAVFLDWFRLCLRHGWFGSLRRATNAHELVEARDGGYTEQVAAARRRHRLDLPYGPAAAALGLGTLDPPWRYAAEP